MFACELNSDKVTTGKVQCALNYCHVYTHTSICSKWGFFITQELTIC